MNTSRCVFFALWLTALLLLGGCASMASEAAGARAELAPTGSLRVGVYPGNPTSLVLNAKSGDKAGMAYDLGKALARELEVPAIIVEYSRVAQVIDALKVNALDFTITDATESRARDVDFSDPLLQLELGYLVLPGSPVKAIEDVDRRGRRIGVTQGGTSQGALTRQLRNAAVVPAASLKAAQELLLRREIDAFATDKGVLFELSDELPGSKVLEGRWGVENLAMAIPKGRQGGMPFLRRFVREMRAGGRLQEMVERAGLRGIATAALQ